ncbi:MAG: phosphonate C-P lyase system protein PhnG [Pseudomonadota bacterium]|nr:phosphonate C-P lyase system protein PhnG [Pseudomonadota bacterium]
MRIPDQSQWLRALSSVPRQAVSDLTGELTASWEVRHTTLPQAGLAMVRMTDGGLGEPFYLGEIPLATARVEIRTHRDGAGVEGAAQVMDDSTEFARQLAVCDAVVAHRLPGWERVVELMASGERQADEETRRRKAMLAKTRVDFSLLDATGADDDD